jgi:hypothetical protein
MTNKIYRAESRNQSGDSYWRYFQLMPMQGQGTPHYDWHTSRFHDRGWYLVASDWVIEQHEDGITITVPPLGKTIVGYPYDHAETKRLEKETVEKLINQTYDKIDKATEAMASQERASEDTAIQEANEAVVEISANHVWLSGPGALVRIDEISFCVAIEDERQDRYPAGTFPSREKSTVVMKNGGQVTLDLPLEVLYSILGSLAPKG